MVDGWKYVYSQRGKKHHQKSFFTCLSGTLKAVCRVGFAFVLGIKLKLVARCGQ